jgi:LPXTG-motif cell wall-anchored protein
VDEISEKDDSIYYIKNNGATTTESGEYATVVLPETGSIDLILETVGAISVGISGFALRKKIRGY